MFSCFVKENFNFSDSAFCIIKKAKRLDCTLKIIMNLKLCGKK